MEEYKLELGEGETLEEKTFTNTSIVYAGMLENKEIYSLAVVRGAGSTILTSYNLFIPATKKNVKISESISIEVLAVNPEEIFFRLKEK